MFVSLRRSIVVVAVAATSTVSAGLAQTTAWGAAPAAPSAPTVTSPAPGAPGALSHFDLARKDCLGTARNTTSKIWYTVANGVLSDVYAPTDRHHQRRDDAVPRHRRLDVHRPADPRHDLHGVRRRDRHDLHGHLDRRRVGALPADAPRISTDTARDSVVVHTQYTPLTDAAQQLPAVRAARRDRRRQRRRRQRQRRRRHRADRRHVDRVAGPGLLRHGDHHQRRQPRLRGADATSRCVPTGRSAQSAAASSARRATGSPSSTHPRARPPTDTAHRRQRRADGRAATRPATGRRTLALGFGTTQAAAVATAGATSRTLHRPAGVATTRRGWQHYDAGLRPPATHLPGSDQRAAGGGRRRQYYVSANVREGQRGQDVPRRDRRPRSPRRGARRSRPATRQHLLRLLPRGVRPRPLRGVDRRCSPTATSRPRGTPTRFLLLRPAAARRFDAAQLARQRQDRAGLVQHPARRGRLPDPDGPAVRARRRHDAVAAHPGARRTS